MKRFGFYFLQRNAGGRWDTLEQAQSVTVLRSSLADQLAEAQDAELRIVGATFVPTQDRWVYTQLFYIDQGSIDLGIAEEAAFDADEGEDGDAASQDDTPTHQARPETPSEVPPEIAPDNPPEAPPQSPPEPQPPTDRSNVVAMENEWERLREQAGQEARGDAAAAPARDEAAELAQSWMRRRRDEPLQAPQDDDLPPPFQLSRPGRKPRTLLLVTGAILGVVLLALAGLGVLLYVQHPLVMQAADDLGLGDYARMPAAWLGSAHEGAMAPAPGAPPPPPRGAQVQPPTTGQVVRYKGVAPSLIGRWSSGDCQRSFIELTDEGYRRTIDGTASAEFVTVSETQEDDYQYLVRRAANLVEHFQKLGADDIRLAGVTGQTGFMASAATVEVLSRCRP